MHFKVFSLRKCYKWIYVLATCALILSISHVTKNFRASKVQTENLIQQVEAIENKEEVKVKEEKMIIPAKEPTLDIPKEYDGWDIVRETNNT